MPSLTAVLSDPEGTPLTLGQGTATELGIAALEHLEGSPSDDDVRSLVLYAARRYDAGERADLEAGMAKLFASEAAMEIALDAVRIHGGYGYSTEFDVERYYRDAPLMAIGEGTNDVMRMVIARALVRGEVPGAAQRPDPR